MHLGGIGACATASFSLEPERWPTPSTASLETLFGAAETRAALAAAETELRVRDRERAGPVRLSHGLYAAIPAGPGNANCRRLPGGGSSHPRTRLRTQNREFYAFWARKQGCRPTCGAPAQIFMQQDQLLTKRKIHFPVIRVNRGKTFQNRDRPSTVTGRPCSSIRRSGQDAFVIDGFAAGTRESDLRIAGGYPAAPVDIPVLF